MARQAGWGPKNEEPIGEIDQRLSIGDALGGERTDTKEAEAYAEHMAVQEEKSAGKEPAQEQEEPQKTYAQALLEEFKNEQVELADREVNNERIHEVVNVQGLEDIENDLIAGAEAREMGHEHDAEQAQFSQVDQELERDDKEPTHEGPAEEGLGSIEITEIIEESVEQFHEERQEELVDQGLELEDHDDHEAEQEHFAEVDQALEAPEQDIDEDNQVEMAEQELEREAQEPSHEGPSDHDADRDFVEKTEAAIENFDEGIEQGDDYAEVAQAFDAEINEARETHEVASQEVPGMESAIDDREAHEIEQQQIEMVAAHNAPEVQELEAALEDINNRLIANEVDKALEAPQVSLVEQHGAETPGLDLFEDLQVQAVEQVGHEAEQSAHEQFSGGAHELHDSPAAEMELDDGGWER